MSWIDGGLYDWSSTRKPTRKVAVVGGGLGEATTAKYLRMMDPFIEVTLVEPNSTYYTCPFSNFVIGGVKVMPAIAHDYKTLQSKYEVNFVRARAYQVKSNVVVLEDGTKVPFDLARYTQEWIFAMTKCQDIVKVSKKRCRIPGKLDLKQCIRDVS